MGWDTGLAVLERAYDVDGPAVRQHPGPWPTPISEVLTVTDRTCSVDDCALPVKCVGMCAKHSSRWYRHGNVHHSTRPMPRGASVNERFWSKVDHSGGPDACWPWTAAIWSQRGGYGKFQAGTGRADNRAVRSHRFAYEQAHGPIDRNLWVLHRCDNPPCCNPAHLFLGDGAANTADMVAKGRDRFWGHPHAV